MKRHGRIQASLNTTSNLGNTKSQFFHHTSINPLTSSHRNIKFFEYLTPKADFEDFSTHLSSV